VTREGSLAFVEVTDPENPAYIGYMPSCTACGISSPDDTVPDVRVFRDVLFRSEGEVGGGSGRELVGMDLRRLVSLAGSMCPDASPWIREGICFLPDVSLDVENAGGREDIITDLKQNAQVIVQHGKRANSIVHAMMQHASGGTGQREATDINALVSEHIDLAYYGKRAQVPDLLVENKTGLGWRYW
jgi:hypothetical protein